ncbi:MAG: alanine racemase [Patescibacteria group bacterium]
MISKSDGVNKNNGEKNGVRTWIELNAGACGRNIKSFRKLIKPKTKLWSVVKSNAYGHGLPVFPELADKFGVDGFCVDSLVEGLRLRKEGIKKPILVLGFTLPQRLEEAAANDITVTISNQESLKALRRAKRKPFYHLKIDTGMNRQGFYPEDVPKISEHMDSKLSGAYSHFASAKDMENSIQSAYTEKQFSNFRKALYFLEKGGFSKLTKHISASAGTIVSPEYHLDAVRVGIGLYGLWPSSELERKFSKSIKIEPVLSWRTIISEVKTAKPGSYVGYDLTEKITKPTKYALIPVGYWHGLSRSLSGKGKILVKGKKARILGRVSMDMAVVDVSGINCRPGDIATIIGRSYKAESLAADIAELSGTSHYEFLTRLNPLMEKIIV